MTQSRLETRHFWFKIIKNSVFLTNRLIDSKSTLSAKISQNIFSTCVWKILRFSSCQDSEFFSKFSKFHFQNFWTSRFVLINWKYWINSTFEWEISRYHIEFSKTSKHDSFTQLFRFWHIKHWLHVVLICLIKNVEQNQRILTLQKWQKSIHYRNSFESWKIASLSKLCTFCECFARLILCNVCDAMMSFSSQLNAHSLDFRYCWLFE